MIVRGPIPSSVLRSSCTRLRIRYCSPGRSTLTARARKSLGVGSGNPRKTTSAASCRGPVRAITIHHYAGRGTYEGTGEKAVGYGGAVVSPGKSSRSHQQRHTDSLKKAHIEVKTYFFALFSNIREFLHCCCCCSIILVQ